MVGSVGLQCGGLLFESARSLDWLESPGPSVSSAQGGCQLAFCHCAQRAGKKPRFQSFGAGAKTLAPGLAQAYGYKPLLLETYVESKRFAATSYRAANWIHVGKTCGRGRQDREHREKKPIKDIYV